MFKKNTAVVGFGIGNFINASTGDTVTTGTPVETRIIDGTGAALTNAATYNSDASEWEIDLDAADMNGDVIGLTFKLADCLPISYTIKTVLGVPSATIAPASEYDTEMARITANVATASALATHDGKLDTVDGIVDTILIATASILADTNELQSDDIPTLISNLNDITVADIIAGIADGSYDLQEMLRIMFAVLAGKSTGGGTTSIAFRDSGDSKDRVVATVDPDGNRTNVTLIET